MWKFWKNYEYIENNSHTSQIGLNFSGGGGTGGVIEFGLAYSYSSRTGYKFGSYATIGMGSYFGYGGGINLVYAYSNNSSINDLSDFSFSNSVSTGVSFTPISVGYGSSLSLTGSRPTYSLSLGLGLGTPAVTNFVTDTE